MSMYLSKPDLIRWTADQLERARASIDRSDAPKVLDTAKEAIYERLFDVIHEGKFDLPEPEPRTVEVVREVPAEPVQQTAEAGTAPKAYHPTFAPGWVLGLTNAHNNFGTDKFEMNGWLRALEAQYKRSAIERQRTWWPKVATTLQSKYWDLVAKHGKSLWSLTDEGALFVQGRLAVHARVYHPGGKNGIRTAWDEDSPLVGAADLLPDGHRFREFVPNRYLYRWEKS